MSKNIYDLAKRIDLENDKFEAMTPAQKRVAVAQDLIERVRLNNFIPNPKSFIRRWNSNSVESEDFPISDHEGSIKSLVNTCELPVCMACAKGGLFLSYIGRVNKFNSDELTYYSNNLTDNQHSKLLEIFDAEQLAYIEYAFENHQFIKYDLYRNAINISSNERVLLESFYLNYPNPSDRIIAIAENIITNEGTFKL